MALPCLATAIAVAGCSPTRSEAGRGFHAVGVWSSPLGLSEAELSALADRPDLRSRVRTNPYAYFRLLSSAFSQRVCADFEPLADEMPLVNLHGDAHLEQYAITPSAHGLHDFDEAGMGPAVVDLVRFASSIHMACRSTGFVCDPEAAVETFLDAYATALADPDAPVPVPGWVERVRRRAPVERATFLEWAESIMRTPDSLARERIMTRWALFARMMTRLGATRSDDSYGVLRMGSTVIGVGSALDTKFLLRIRGETESPDDDVVVEIKPMSEVEAPCLLRTPAGGMLRTLLPAARLGRLQPEVLGYLPWDEKSEDRSQWWIQSWDFGYRELKVADLGSQADLEAIARDVGLQLGRGHCNGIAAPLEDLHRAIQSRAFELSRDRVRTLSRQLADDVFQGWVRFREGG